MAAATVVILAIGAVPALAQQTSVSVEDFQALVDAVNTVWVALAAALVVLMHLGFGMLEAGLTRAKNAANIVGKNMMTVAIGGAAYWAIGAALAYGSDAGGFIGTSGFFEPGRDLAWATAPRSCSSSCSRRPPPRSCPARWPNASSSRPTSSSPSALTAVIYPIVSHWKWSATGRGCATSGSTTSPGRRSCTSPAGRRRW